MQSKCLFHLTSLVNLGSIESWIHLLISHAIVDHTSSCLYSIPRTYIHNSILGIWMPSVFSYQWIVLWSILFYVSWARHGGTCQWSRHLGSGGWRLRSSRSRSVIEVNPGPAQAKHKTLWWLILITDLTQCIIIWEECLSEKLSGSDWLVDLPVRDILKWVN